MVTKSISCRRFDLSFITLLRNTQTIPTPIFISRSLSLLPLNIQKSRNIRNVHLFENNNYFIRVELCIQNVLCVASVKEHKRNYGRHVARHIQQL